MTVKALIDAVDLLKPNSFSDDQKVAWLNTLEASIQLNIWRRLPGETIAAYVWATDQSVSLLLSAPWDDMYTWYLSAMIDAANGEYSKYQNTMQMFNARWTDYLHWFVSAYDPAQADRTLTLLGSVTYEAVSAEAAELYTLPAGALLMRVVCVVETAFDSGDSDVLILGTADDADALMADADVDETEAGTYSKAVMMTGGVSGAKIYATLTRTGTDATAGAASFYGLVLEPANGWEV